ncbi:uncharacterized protein LOC144146374 [Haemaphysalis longicornis]
MNLALLATFVCTVGTTTSTRKYPTCGQQRIDITALDNTTCIPPYYRELQDNLGNCTSSVHVVTNCTCQDGNSVSGNQYCVFNVRRTDDDNTVNVTLGTCGAGKCHTYDFQNHMEVDARDIYVAYNLKAYARPTCKAVNLSVTSELRAAMGCEFFCYGRKNRDINDGRPCVYEWYQGLIPKRPVVTLTGSCHNGICQAPESSSARQTNSCYDRDRYTNNNRLKDSRLIVPYI